LFGQEILTKNLCFGLVLSRNLDKNAFTAEKPSIKQGLPVKKKRLLTAIIISTLLLSAVAGIQLFSLGRANPYIKGGNTPPPEDIQPPTISIFSPNNNTMYASDNITLTFDVTMPEDTYTLCAVYFEVDWQEGNTSVYYSRTAPDNLYIKNLTGIPEGKHRITITAVAHGYYIEGYTSYSYDINGSSSVYFSIEKQIIGEPFPTTLVARASVATIAVVGMGLLVYFKKRRKESGV
jgi:hypothetical protein